MKCVCLGEASLSQMALFCTFCVPLRENCWKYSELFLNFHKAFGFYGEKYAQVGNNCSDLCAPSDLGRTNSCIEFSPFSFHPGVVSGWNGS